MVEKVEVNLSENVKFGESTMLVRLMVQDRRDIGKAAQALNITQSQFLRNVAVQVARKVLAETASESS